MPPPIRRLEWIDLFRGLAVLGMVWTHSANTFLEAQQQATSWYGELTYYHGLIAPAFFWISGFVRAHVTQGAIRPAWPAMKRLLMVLLIGYIMHFPWLALLAGHVTADDWRAGMKVNVLHVMAVTGMLMLLVERLGSRWRNVAAAVLLVFFVALETPAENWRTGFTLLDQYLNRSQGSLFSLFPWVAFGLAGFVTRALWDGRLNRQGMTLGVLSAPLALGLVSLSSWIDRAPAFFVERLAWAVLAAVLVSFVGEGARVIAATGWLRLAGRESLVLYVAHLVMIHAIPAPRTSLELGIGKTQPLWMVAVIAAILFALSLGLGWLNERKKAASRRKQAADQTMAGR
ncbi:MAG: heparan-alpha-glucosaminide N-acetyltransferase domain-containing protein [Prosthecobacter sp.]